VLLLDEPLGALDRKLREEMQIELKELQRRLGISFVFVTHDQDEALAMSDVVVVMNAGRIEQMGTPREIYERPATRFIADFVGVTNIFAEGTKAEVAVRPERVRFAGDDEANAIPGTIESARYLGDVTHWHVRLDDGASWIVLSQNDGKASDVEPGRRVRLAWAPEHSIHFKA